jgi:hypothetical protein
MTGPEHYRRAEMLANEAYKRLGGEDEASAAAWAALAQVHAQLASTAAAVQAQTRMPHSVTEAWERALGLTPRGQTSVLPGSIEPEGGRG